MKLSKIFTIALAALMLTACSDDDDYNTASGVSVSMADATISKGENCGLFGVPVNVTGEANGPIKVTVEVTEATENPAKEEVNYRVTSKTIIIPADKKQGQVEIYSIYEKGVENDPRSFEVTITKVEGATVGSIKSTVVTLTDVDADPYVKLTGVWKFTALDNTGAPVEMTLTMSTPESDSEYYGTELYAYGFKGYDYCYIPFEYERIGDDYTLQLPLGWYMTDYLINFGFNGVIESASVKDGNIVLKGAIPCSVDSKYTEISFNPADELYVAVFDYDSGSFMGGWGRYNTLKFVR